jgi:hypothetical protein
MEELETIEDYLVIFPRKMKKSDFEELLGKKVQLSGSLWLTNKDINKPLKTNQPFKGYVACRPRIHFLERVTPERNPQETRDILVSAYENRKLVTIRGSLGYFGNFEKTQTYQILVDSFQPLE